MDVSGFWAIFGIGCFGGAIGEIAKWFQLRESTNLPAYLRSVFYWVMTLLMIAVGGGLAAIYGLDAKNAVLVANIGLSAPLIIKTLTGINPVPQNQPVPKGLAPTAATPGPSLINFLAGR